MQELKKNKKSWSGNITLDWMKREIILKLLTRINGFNITKNDRVLRMGL